MKVLDFGVAKFVAPPDAATEVPDTVLTAAGATVGTPAYMSPEQLEGREIDHRADQFAFGVVLLRDALGPAAVSEVTTAAEVVGLDPARSSRAA